MKFLKILIIAALFLPASALAAVLPVPFTMQAPEGKWVQPWADACEEAVTVMVDHYYKGDTSQTIPKLTAIAEIKEIVGREDWYFGFNKDTNADQMVRFINLFYRWEAYVVENPSLAQIKDEIDIDQPVIALVHGRALKNPYFRNGGPDYHTVVIKGYDDDTQEFITNEPGVGRGLDYRYTYDTLLNALHDFVPGQKTKTGRPVVIFTKPTPDFTGESDGAGSLVKLATSPKVYLLEHGTYRHIIDEETYLGRGWQWHQIKTVSPSFLNALQPGADIAN